MFNIFSLSFVAVLVAIVLAMLVTRQKTPGNRARVPPEDDFDAPDAALQSMDSVVALAEGLCLESALSIREKVEVSPNETYWIAESTSPVFQGQYVFGLLRVSTKDECVTLASLLEFKDFVKSTGSTKGLMLTNGFFTRDVHQPLEGPRVSLYNSRRIQTELARLGAI